MTDRHPGVSGADADYRSPPGAGEGTTRRWTLRVRDRPRRDLADLRSHRLRHQGASPPPSPRRLAARMRSVASAEPSERTRQRLGPNRQTGTARQIEAMTTFMPCSFGL